MHIYALMFVAESGTLYVYYYGWDKMKEGFLKWIHLSMSVVLNVIGTLLMFLANSWIGFMMSPAGVDEQGRYLGNIWHVIHTALWNPLNVHRILGNMAFGGGVVAAYAAYKFLASKTDEDRAHYDWMGYIAMALGVSFLIPLTVRRLLADARGLRLPSADGDYAHGWPPGLAFHYSSHHDRYSLLEQQLLSLAGAWSDARC